ncbi:MAG: pseudouridine synthase [Bacteroidales bacterium]|nr:pseudouridine synthase [Bacteroidales bacterium]
MKEEKMNSLQQKFAKSIEEVNEDSASDSRNHEERREHSRRNDTILSSDDFSIEENGIEYKPKRRFNKEYSHTRRDKHSHHYNNEERDDRPQRYHDDERPRRYRDDDDNNGRPRRYHDDEHNGRKSFYSRNDNENREDSDNRYGRRSRYNHDENDDERGRRYNNDNRHQRYNRNEHVGERDEDRKSRYNNRSSRPRRDGEDYRNRPQRFSSARKYIHDDSSDAEKFSYGPKITREDDGMIRLNKFISDSGYCSRREADDLISSGSVKVNGIVVDVLGTKINRTDKVQIGNETLHNEKLKYLLLNKPKGYITTMDDPQKRNTVLQLIDGACRERLFPVGRLDRKTSGLLLFTNDGELANKLMHPKGNITKVYHVVLDKSLTRADLETIANGIELDDGYIKVDSIAYADPNDKKEIGVEIHSGRNHIVRRIFESLGYTVVKLDRTLYAGLTKKDLPRGSWRFLTQQEVNFLKML